VAHSGVFDRVLLHRAPDGRAQRAVLIDFKTERPLLPPPEAAAIHRRQLMIYRQALGRLLGLPEEKIRAVILFTATRQAVDL
jgi:PD-(D/E)XK nuclease superfamily